MIEKKATLNLQGRFDLACNGFQHPCKSPLRNASAHLVLLHFGHQVFEGRRATESHHVLTLVGGQTLDLGQGHARQNNLLAAQEVLELHVEGALTAESRLSGLY